MKENYVPVTFQKGSFNCPFCRAFAHQKWIQPYQYAGREFIEYTEIIDHYFCQCDCCYKKSIWKGEVMIYPDADVNFQPHPEMVDDLKSDYLEASSIFQKSPRGATALLRLVIQKLMPILGEKGKNINNDIASLVKKGLPIEVQQTLDYCRVIGNSAVHPAELNIHDTPEIAIVLFEMINFIIEEQISRPKKIKKLYESLPQNAKDAIIERDKK